jgi:hypothetical protein
MYTTYTTDIEKIIKRIESKGFSSITSQQKKIFLSEVESVEFINTRERFILWILIFVWYRSMTTCVVKMKNGEKIFMDLSLKDINKYKFANFVK